MELDYVFIESHNFLEIDGCIKVCSGYRVPDTPRNLTFLDVIDLVLKLAIDTDIEIDYTIIRRAKNPAPSEALEASISPSGLLLINYKPIDIL